MSRLAFLGLTAVYAPETCSSRKAPHPHGGRCCERKGLRTEVRGFVQECHTFLTVLVRFAVPKKGVLFIIGDWSAKVGSQETPGVTGKFLYNVLVYMNMSSS